MWDGVDRRHFPRAEYPCLITVRKNTLPKQAILTHTENISVGGVRVIIWERIEMMTEVDLEIDLKDTLPIILSKGTINWVEKIPSGEKGKPAHYDTGIQFIGLKDDYRGRVRNIVGHLLNRAG